jgi:transcription elongation GreA/GreB family factor
MPCGVVAIDMTNLPNKKQVLDALIEALSRTLHHTVHAAEEVRRDATHEEARPENDKDTRALEQTYLARGQAMRAEAMVEQLQSLRTLSVRPLPSDAAISAGALIELEDEAAARRYVFLAPCGGGEVLRVDGLEVLVVTPVSAMGRALLGKQVGDEFELRVHRATRDYVITAVS